MENISYRAGESVRQRMQVSTRVLDSARRLVRFIGSTEHLDRYRTVLKGWVTDHYQNNPVFQWAHLYDIPPIGRAVSVQLNRKKQLEFDIEFTPADLNEFGFRMFRMVEEGFLNAVSVGFVPGKVDYVEAKKGANDSAARPHWVLSNNELLELSLVPVPANPHALKKSVDMNLITGAERSVLFRKSKWSVPESIVQATDATRDECLAWAHEQRLVDIGIDDPGHRVFDSNQQPVAGDADVIEIDAGLWRQILDASVSVCDVSCDDDRNVDTLISDPTVRAELNAALNVASGRHVVGVDVDQVAGTATITFGLTEQESDTMEEQMAANTQAGNGSVPNAGTKAVVVDGQVRILDADGTLVATYDIDPYDRREQEQNAKYGYADSLTHDYLDSVRDVLSAGAPDEAKPLLEMARAIMAEGAAHPEARGGRISKRNRSRLEEARASIQTVLDDTDKSSDKETTEDEVDTPSRSAHAFDLDQLADHIVGKIGGSIADAERKSAFRMIRDGDGLGKPGSYLDHQFDEMAERIERSVRKPAS